MSEGLEVTYVYDGSYEGFLTCVFESYSSGTFPLSIITEDSEELSLLIEKVIVTDHAHAGRVKRGIRNKVSAEAEELCEKAFLSCMDKKEIKILSFIRKALKTGPDYMRMLADPELNEINNAVRHLSNEAHLFTGFLRFSEYNGMLYAAIDPKNDIIPLIAHHFCDRFHGETFVIYDTVHRKALFYSKGKSKTAAVDSFDVPTADENELMYRGLWRQFFKTIAIEGRINPTCQRTNLPLRYRGNMTEFIGDTDKPRGIGSGSETKKIK